MQMQEPKQCSLLLGTGQQVVTCRSCGARGADMLLKSIDISSSPLALPPDGQIHAHAVSLGSGACPPTRTLRVVADLQRRSMRLRNAVQRNAWCGSGVCGRATPPDTHTTSCSAASQMS